MRIEQEFTVEIPIERLYLEMNNVADIGYCIEGVKKVQALSETETRWVVEARAGFMARTFQLAGVITERRPPTYLAFAGAGQDLKLSGFFELTALQASETKCRAVVDCEVVGSFKTIVDLMAKGPQQQMIAKTISNVRRRLEGAAGSGAPMAQSGAEGRAPGDAGRAQGPEGCAPGAEGRPPRSKWRAWIVRVLHALRASIGLSPGKQVR